MMGLRRPAQFAAENYERRLKNANVGRNPGYFKDDRER